MNEHFNITYNTENDTFPEATSNKNLLDQGFKYFIEDLFLSKEEFYKFIEVSKNKYNLKTYDFSDSTRNVFMNYTGEDVIIFASGNSKEMFISINTKTLDMSNELFTLYKKYIKHDEEVKVYITTYFSGPSGVDSSAKALNEKELEFISDSYYPYIDNSLMYNQFITNQENILIMAGAAGLGKSKLSTSILKYCTKNPDIIPHDKLEDGFNDVQFITVAIVKSNEVLSSDLFWRELDDKEYDFVILDDLDYFLSSRTNEVTSNDEDMKNKFLNQFLSYTDGIEKNKTKFIITTNQYYKDIDTAVLRKGRLFDILELRDLTFKEALVIWKENDLTEDELKECFKENERILPADLGSEISKRKNDMIADSIAPYILEDNISKIKLNKTKIGF